MLFGIEKLSQENEVVAKAAEAVCTIARELAEHDTDEAEARAYDLDEETPWGLHIYNYCEVDGEQVVDLKVILASFMEIGDREYLVIRHERWGKRRQGYRVDARLVEPSLAQLKDQFPEIDESRCRLLIVKMVQFCYWQNRMNLAEKYGWKDRKLEDIQNALRNVLEDLRRVAADPYSPLNQERRARPDRERTGDRRRQSRRDSPQRRRQPRQPREASAGKRGDSSSEERPKPSTDSAFSDFMKRMKSGSRERGRSSRTRPAPNSSEQADENSASGTARGGKRPKRASPPKKANKPLASAEQPVTLKAAPAESKPQEEPVKEIAQELPDRQTVKPEAIRDCPAPVDLASQGVRRFIRTVLTQAEAEEPKQPGEIRLYAIGFSHDDTPIEEIDGFFRQHFPEEADSLRYLERSSQRNGRYLQPVPRSLWDMDSEILLGMGYSPREVDRARIKPTGRINSRLKRTQNRIRGELLALDPKTGRESQPVKVKLAS